MAQVGVIMSGKREVILSVTKDEFEVQTFRAGGKGGQNQNKRDTGVRVIHRASGAVGESREERSQLQNKRKAFRRCVESLKFKMWLNMRVMEVLEGRSIEREVDEWMKPEYLKIEYIGNDE